MRQGIAPVCLVTASSDSRPYVHAEWVPHGLGDPSRARVPAWLSHGFSPGGSGTFACLGCLPRSRDRSGVRYIGYVR
jgi:hypothetical protein